MDLAHTLDDMPTKEVYRTNS